MYSLWSLLWLFWWSKSPHLSWNMCGPWDCYSLWSQLNKVPATQQDLKQCLVMLLLVMLYYIQLGPKNTKIRREAKSLIIQETLSKIKGSQKVLGAVSAWQMRIFLFLIQSGKNVCIYFITCFFEKYWSVPSLDLYFPFRYIGINKNI